MANPETYSAALAATLAEFSPSVMAYVTDPRTGIVSRCKNPPSVAELREACERAAAMEYERAHPKPKITAQPFVRTPANPAPLFCPEGYPGWKYHEARHREEGGTLDNPGRSGSHYGTGMHGQPGLWVPVAWHDAAKGSRFTSGLAPSPLPPKTDEAPASEPARAPIVQEEDATV